jgi:tartrate dehydrogenase/decarboxylase/D-malate dehydrogenase
LGRALSRDDGEYPDIRTDQFHIDILCAHFVQRPKRSMSSSASNLFGDILSDLGPSVCGTIGIAPPAISTLSARFPSLFEPCARIGARYRGKGHRQSDRTDLVGAMLLDFLGHRRSGGAVVAAIERVLADAACPRTPDIGGRATTTELGRAIAAAL